MEITILVKGNKYTVQDKQERLLYSVKKKGFGSKYLLLDASKYQEMLEFLRNLS